MTVDKVLFHLSWLSSLYFLLLLLDAFVFKTDFVLVGFVREFCTIPVIFAQFGIGVTAAIYWIKDNFKLKSYSLWAILITLCNSAFIVISFLGHID